MMRRRMYGAHGAVLSTRARAALRAMLTGIELAAVVGMPVWLLLLGVI